MSDNNELGTGFTPDYSQGGVPKDDTDLSGMEYPQAAEYVMSFVSTLKQTEKLVKEVEKDANLWKERVALAEGQGKADLAAAARKRLDETESKLAKLKTEEEELAQKCSELVQNLKKVKATGVTRLVDTDRLLADFEMIIGDKDKGDYTLKQQIKNEEADVALQRLKEKMQGEKKE